MRLFGGDGGLGKGDFVDDYEAVVGVAVAGREGGGDRGSGTDTWRGT